MKKILSIVLIVSLILAMSTTSFAEDTKLTITDSDGRTYVGYKLLELSTSLKDGHHHPAGCDGINHSDDCYNYAYTINEKYKAVLQAETLENGRNELWIGTGKPATSSGVMPNQILEYLSYQTSDNGDTYMTMRQVADRIYRAIKTAGIDPDVTGLDGNNDSISQGYWMLADVSTLTGNASNSLVMVNTKGQEAITVNPKTALPTVEKKVKDIEDSEDDSILDNPWHDSADHDIGDTVPFKLTATLPSNAQYYQSYKIIFHDTMSNGLAVDDTSFKVYMYDTKHKADVDTDLNDYAADVTASFTKNMSPGDGCTFDIGCDNVFGIVGVTKDTAFVVYYEATLDTDAAIGGAAGNPNEVYLEFSNDPYGNGTGKTEVDKVNVYTYKLVINKTDSMGHDLEGAGFKLYKKQVDGTYTMVGTELTGLGMTEFTWTGLDDGDYKLEESIVPPGYNKMSDIVFSISAAHSEVAGEPQLLNLDGGLIGLGDVSTGIIEKDIENHTGTILPETGAAGTMLLVGGGALLVLLAAVFMITRKKMSIYED